MAFLMVGGPSDVFTARSFLEDIIHAVSVFAIVRLFASDSEDAQAD